LSWAYTVPEENPLASIVKNRNPADRCRPIFQGFLPGKQPPPHDYSSSGRHVGGSTAKPALGESKTPNPSRPEEAVKALGGGKRIHRQSLPGVTVILIQEPLRIVTKPKAAASDRGSDPLR
jgi:hypothetical protein